VLFRSALPEGTFLDVDASDYIEVDLPPSVQYWINVKEPKFEISSVATEFTPQGGSGSGEGTPSLGKESGKMLGLRDSDVEWTPFLTNPNSIKENYTIPTGSNASIVSPTIEDGVTVTVPDGSILVIH